MPHLDITIQRRTEETTIDNFVCEGVGERKGVGEGRGGGERGKGSE